MTLSDLSTEYVRVPVARDDGSSPTSDSVALAFVPPGNSPGSGDWHAGTWETVNGVYYGRVLVGPSQVALDVGVYEVWIKITDNPEIPVRLAGELAITA